MKQGKAFYISAEDRRRDTNHGGRCDRSDKGPGRSLENLLNMAPGVFTSLEGSAGEGLAYKKISSAIGGGNDVCYIFKCILDGQLFTISLFLYFFQHPKADAAKGFMIY